MLFKGIDQSPISVNISIDTVAVFNCTVNADIINWKVNGSEPPPNAGFIQSDYEVDMSRCLKTASLTANVSSCYTSNVQCFAHSVAKNGTCYTLTMPATFSVFCKSESSFYINNIYVADM